MKNRHVIHNSCTIDFPMKSPGPMRRSSVRGWRSLAPNSRQGDRARHGTIWKFDEFLRERMKFMVFFCVSRDFLDIVYLQVAFDRFFLLHVPTDSIVFGFRKRIWFQGYRFYSQWIIFTCVDICIHPLYGCPVVYTYLDYTSTVSHSYVFFCQKMSKIALLMEKKTIIETGDVQVLHHSLEGSPQFQSFHSIAPQRRHYCLGCSPSLVGQYQIFGKETCCIPLSILACFTPCLPFWRWLGYMPSPTMHNWAIPPILCNVGSWLVWPPLPQFAGTQ